MGTNGSEPELGYRYRNDQGDTLVFTPAGDEAVVSFDPGATQETAEALDGARAGAVRTVNPAVGFAIVRVRGADDSESLAALENAADDANAMPVLLDAEGNRRYFLPDQLTVQFAEGVDDAAAREVIAGLGSEVVVAQRTAGYYTVSVPEDSDVFAAIRAYDERSDVAFAEPSEIGLDSELATTVSETDPGLAPPEDRADEPGDAPDDLDAGGTALLDTENGSDAEVVPGYADFSKLWGLFNHGQTVDGTTGTVDADIDGTIAWDIHQGRSNVVVAVIDTGADLDHPDLASQLLPRGTEDWDFAAPDGVPDDSNSHGTHVAGTAVGNQNGSGVSGVAPRCRLMPLRVNLTSGMNQNRADAINYVASRATANSDQRYVINCSWRMNGDHAGVRNAIRNAVARNVVVVFAAGNSNRDIDTQPQYPAVYPEVIAVAATDQRDERASFSNYGTRVDVAAPGVNIWSSVLAGGHGFKDGTSMASPHAAGVAALIWSRNSSLSNAHVRRILEATTDDIDARNPGFAGQLGTGRVNAYRALRATPPPRLPARLVRTLPFPQANAGSSTALTFIPGLFLPWVGLRSQLLFLTQQAGSERIWFLRPTNGSVLRSIDPQANDTIGSMAWDGSSIRVANVTTGAGRINAINPSTGAQTGSIPAPAGRGEGMAWEGGYLYYSTITHIHKVRPSTGQVLWSRPAPKGECRGMASGGGFLFTADSSSGVVTIIRPSAPSLVHATVRVPGSGSHRADALAYDARRRELYVADQDAERINVLRINP